MLFWNVYLYILLFQLKTAYDQVVVPLEQFRKKHIGGVKVSFLFILLIKEF